MPYTPTLAFQRTPSERADALLAWQRPDQAFFAAGACHILAFAFLEAYPRSGFGPVLVQPKAGHRGTHVFVTDGAVAFDHAGYTPLPELREATWAAYRAAYEGWDAALVPITTDLETFCREHDSRSRRDYPFDPWDRAMAYLKKFPSPVALEP